MFNKRIKSLEEKNKDLEEKNKDLEEKILEYESKMISLSPNSFTSFIARINTLISSKDSNLVKYAIKTLTDYLTFKEATHCLLKGDLSYSEKNDRLKSLFTYDPIKNDFRKSAVCNLVFSINDLNLILNTWYATHIVTSIKNINSACVLEPDFDNNIRNTYIYPLDIVICDRGNHSQLSAKLRDEGETRVTEIYDISNLYSFIEFDGKNFVDVNNKDEIKKTCDTEEEVIIGALFEIGRLLKDHPKYFDTKIMEQLKKGYQE